MASKKSNQTNENNETTALAVSVPIAQPTDIVTEFSNLDLEKLNKAVEDIANRTGKLSNKEKTFAMQVIDQWETGVVEQLRDEHDRVQSFVRMAKNFTSEYKSIIDNPDYIQPMLKLIEIADIGDRLEDIREAMDEAKFAEEEVNILKRNGIDADETATEMERLEKRHELEKEILVKQKVYEKAQRKLNRVISDFSLDLNRNDNVKAALAKLTALTRALTKNTNECNAKANAAKLAITIDDADLRGKLSALININLG